jgi:hypothetical protein
MGSLRDELLKAKIISKKDAQKAVHEERQKRKDLGVNALEKEQQTRSIEFRKEMIEKSAIDRQREMERAQKESPAESPARLRSIVLKGELPGSKSGSVKYYFVARDGRIPFFEVSPAIASGLETGKYAIVETPAQEMEVFRIITRESAIRLREAAPEYIRTFNDKN